MDWITNTWTWIKDHAEAFETFDPAMLRATWVAIVGLLASLGVLVTPALDNKVNALIGVVVAILAILQGISTKRATVPKLVSENAVAKALYTEVPPDVVPGDFPWTDGDIQDDGAVAA